MLFLVRIKQLILLKHKHPSGYIFCFEPVLQKDARRVVGALAGAVNNENLAAALFRSVPSRSRAGLIEGSSGSTWSSPQLPLSLYEGSHRHNASALCVRPLIRLGQLGSLHCRRLALPLGSAGECRAWLRRYGRLIPSPIVLSRPPPPARAQIRISAEVP
jgi:hypothetical protein